MRDARGVPEGRWKLAGGVSHRIAEKNESAPAGAWEFNRGDRSTAPPGRVCPACGSGGSRHRLISRAPHGPLQSQMIEVMVKKYGRASGIGKHLTPHVWRHTCATHLVAHGASLAAVQLQLGHRSLRTTQIYTRVAVPDLVAMHRHAHPRSRVRGK